MFTSNKIMTDIVNEQELRDIYYDPSEGYKSAEKLYRKAKEIKKY